MTSRSLFFHAYFLTIVFLEPEYRHKGLAFSALNLIFHYSTSKEGPEQLRIPPEQLVARVGETNTASIHVFKKLSFEITKRVPVFQELEMRYRGNGSFHGGVEINYV